MEDQLIERCERERGLPVVQRQCLHCRFLLFWSRFTLTLTLRIKFRKKHEAVDVAPVICWSFFKGLKVCNGVAFLLLTEEPRMRRDIAGSLEHGC